MSPGIMCLLWVLLWSEISPVALLSDPSPCEVHDGGSLQHESEFLKSLKCYNDYKSHIVCKWREHKNTSLELWLKRKSSSERCVPQTTTEDADEHRTRRCRYDTKIFSLSTNHTVFFLKNQTASCSSVPRKVLDLSQHLRARPPVNLSTRVQDDGDRWLSWSSPYPSSSPLSRNLTYQLSYRTDRQDGWTTVDVKNNSVKLEKQSLLPGHRYQCRVRVRASVGHWSHWSPVVTWHSDEGAGQFPSLHCVLHAEKEVMCSWEVSRELAHFITYQLACRQNRAAQFKECCTNLTVSSDPSRTVLRYSCSLTDADPAHLQLELLPRQNAKTFTARQHIRPDPPQQVTVKDKGRSWTVVWTEPNTKDYKLYYQLCYYRIPDEECSTPLNVSTGSTTFTILGDSLAPCQRYQVRVRSLVLPGGGRYEYDGIPSEWTDPVDWTSHDASWSVTTLIYFAISMFVATVFLMLYHTVPACQRRIILWVDSVPSPGKSKILSEIKCATSWTLSQSENTTMCKVLRMDSVSTCSSDTALLPTRAAEKKHLEQEQRCWRCDNLTSSDQKGHISETSSVSFSGPYILCQPSGPNHKSLDVECEEEEAQTPLDDPEPPSPVSFTLFGEGYVCLPSRSASRSTQDLVSHSDANTDTQRHDMTEQDQQSPDTTPWLDKTATHPGLSGPSSSHAPPAYVSGPLTSWPELSAVQVSGYCHLPATT